MLFGLAMVVILAVIGIFICLIAGTYLLNVIMRRHVHVLQKWTRTQQQVVADLAAYKNDNDIEKDINDDENLGPTAPLVQNSHSMYRSLEADKGVYMNV